MHRALKKICKLLETAELELAEKQAELHGMSVDAETDPDKVIQFYIDNVKRLDIKLTGMKRLLSFTALLLGEISDLCDYYDRPAPGENKG